MAKLTPPPGPRETNKFEISVNIKDGEEAKFKLVYQELLHRVRGVYKHQINIQPRQFVSDLQVDVHIIEKLPFRVIHVPKFAPKLDEKSNQQLLDYNKAEEDVTLETSREDGISKASIQWHPPIECQQNLGILDGQLVVLYDVEREEDIGQIQVVDGYFVHYFAPTNLEVGNKNIIFALDTSGSMSGPKINQTKEAMTMILSELRSGDQFNIVSFATSCKAWKNSCMSATKQNVEEANNWVTSLHADGGTDIDGTIQEGISKLKEASRSHSLDDILILLTDGEHNSGGVRRDAITARALQSMKANNKSVKIYGLGFGAEADFGFLKEISLKTRGIARRIYAGSDAALQLRSFYEEISSPVLANVSIRYLNPEIDVDSIVQSSYGHTLYAGSEMVYVGKLLQNLTLESMETSIHGKTVGGQYQRSQPIRNAGPFPDLIPGMDLPQEGKDKKISHSVGSMVERSWAYLTIKNLLDKSETETDRKVTEQMKKDALDLSLKYGFVTAVTSMVAVQPQGGEKKTKQLFADEDQTIDHYGWDQLEQSTFHASKKCKMLWSPVKLCISEEKKGRMKEKWPDLRPAGGSGSPPPGAACGLGYQAYQAPGQLYHQAQFHALMAPHQRHERKTEDHGKKQAKMKPDHKSATFWLEKSPKEVTIYVISDEFNRQEKYFDHTRTLLDLLKKTAPDKAQMAITKLISQSDKFPQNPKIQDSIEKLKRGDQPSESDWVVCCLVVGNFSEDDVKEVCDSVLDYQLDQVSVGSEVTFHMEQNGGYLVLKLKGASGPTSLDVKTRSIFDALEVMYQLTKICSSLLVPHGVEQLFQLLFEANTRINQAEQKIRDIILN